MKQVKMILASILLLIALSACAENNQPKIPVSANAVDTVQTELLNAKGERTGEISLTDTEDGVIIKVIAKGLTPGVKGIHIHSKGVCTAPDFKSAGSHFNPEGKEHGFDNPKGFHLGDLPNIEVDANGNAAYKMMLNGITMEDGSSNTIFDEDGSALVIHADPDDYKTDPSGNSGDRIACAALKRK